MLKFYGHIIQASPSKDYSQAQQAILKLLTTKNDLVTHGSRQLNPILHLGLAMDYCWAQNRQA